MDKLRLQSLIAIAMLVVGCRSQFRITGGDKKNRPITILVSLDGFRHDYIDSFATPNLDQIAKDGVKADALLPVFPTKTFPNHYSIVTGLYPEQHGIVANKMFDQTINSWFQIGAGSKATREPYWFEGEAVWVTAKKQDVKTATLFWPGSDATPDSLKPDYHFYYDNTFDHHARIRQVVSWLKLPEGNRPTLITLYFESPDLEGHHFGPFSLQTEAAVERMDALVGDLRKAIVDLGMQNQVNVLITSDHGMAQLSPDSVIFIDDYIDLHDATLVQTSPKADIIPKAGRDSVLYTQLVRAHPHLRVFWKGEEPERWHYRNHHRITPLTAIADLGWSIVTRREYALKRNSFRGGAHGYDNTNHQMWAIFLATGPDFKSDLSIPAFENVHLYNLLCHLLRIEPSKNAGDPNIVRSVLK